MIAQLVQQRLKGTLNTEALQRSLGVQFPAIVTKPRSVEITEPARPWLH
jgi:hypothetical protein